MIPILCKLTFARKTFKYGPFKLGVFSELFGWIAVLWLTFTSILFVFPSSFPNGPSDWSQTEISLNWTGPVTGFVLAIAFINWWIPFIGCRKTFKCPKRPDDV